MRTKFQNDMAEHLYGTDGPDSEVSFGSDAYVDWYGLYMLIFEERVEYPGVFSAVLHEDNDGFVDISVFATESESDGFWAGLMERAAAEDEDQS